MQTTRKKGLTVKDLVMGLAADLVADIRHYRSKLVNSLSYLILSLGGGHQRLCGAAGCCGSSLNRPGSPNEPTAF